MPQKFRLLLRKSTLRKKNACTPRSGHVDDEETLSRGARSINSDAKKFTSISNPSGVTSLEDGACARPGSETRSKEDPIAADNHGVPFHTNESVTDDSHSYPSLVSPKSEVPSNLQYMSLGGDSRYRTGASEMKHNEDVADRNIIMYGSSSPRGSLGDLSTSNSLKSDLDARRGSLGTYSASSTGSREPMVLASAAGKYTLGTGILTEGGLIDRILPHKEPGMESKFRREDWPHRVARNEAARNWNRRKTTGDEEQNGPHPMQPSLLESTSVSGQYNKTPAQGTGNDDIRNALFDGSSEVNRENGELAMRLDPVKETSDAVKVDKSTQFALAVACRAIESHKHHIQEERAYREIGNHDCYHLTEPVHQTGTPPARNFVYEKHGHLTETPAGEMLHYNSRFQTRCLDMKRVSAESASSRSPRITEPTVITDTSPTMLEDFERTETANVCPSELEDMPGYGELAVRVEFVHDARLPSGRRIETKGSALESANTRQMSHRLVDVVQPEVGGRVGGSLAVCGQC